MAKRPPAFWSLPRLKMFTLVAAAGNLTRVAAAQGVPQSSISRQIVRLETECGGKLFLRTGRGVVLSELGRRLLPKAQAILEDSEQLTDTVRAESRTPSGDVVIGVLPSLYLILIVPLFVHARRHLPAVRMRIMEGSSGQIDQWLAAGTVDLGVLYRFGSKMSEDVEALVHTSSCLVGRKGDELTSRRTVPFSRLDNLPLVLPGAPSSVRLGLDQMARRARIRLNVVLEADSGQIQHALAARAGVYTVTAPHAVQAEIDAGKLQASLIVEPRINRTIALGITSSRPAAGAVRAVARAITRLMADPDAGAPFPAERG